MRAISVERIGGPEVLECVETVDPVATPGTALVAVSAAGVNFIDTYQRSGLYPMPLPFVLGLEGSGTVEAIGAGVSEVAPGDRVAWASGQGSYAGKVVVPARHLVRIPAGVETGAAAAVMLQGITAHYLAIDTFPLGPGRRCLVHAAAGGVGLLLVQIAKRRGAEVFATVGSPDKADLARRAGADHVVDYRQQDFGAAIEAIAGSQPLDVVYDGVGRAVFLRSLDLLRPRGTMVTFGNASGAVDPIAPLELARRGSLYLTRPTIGDYLATREELEGRAADLFSWIAAGELTVHVGSRLPLSEAARAHEMLEARRTTGKLLLIP